MLSKLVTQPAVRHACAIISLLAIGVPLCFHRLGDRALWSSHEGRAGQHAQLMLESGRWGMPTLYFGDADYQKPPLYYWLVAAVARLRGGVVDEWSVRFPAAASGVLTVLIVYAAGCLVFRRPAAGAVAGLVVASNLRFSWLARVGRIDMPLTLAITVALACCWSAFQKSNGFSSDARARSGWWWMLLAYLASAAAVMLKGPVGIVLPLVVMLAFLALERQPIWPWRRGWVGLMHRLGAWWGLPLVAGVAGPWFVWASITTHGEFSRTFLLHHHWDRTLGADGLKPEPIWYYVPRLVVDLFPWCVLVPAAVWGAIRFVRNRDAAGERFALAWAAAMFGFLSLVRFKRHDYLLPVIPGFALLVAGYCTRLGETVSAAAAWLWARVLGWSLCACAAVASLLYWLVCDERNVQRILETAWFRGCLHDSDRMIVAALAGVPQRVTGVAACGVAMAVAGTSLIAAARRRRPLAAALALSIAWLAGVMAVIECVLPVLEPIREQRSLAALARELQPAGAAVAYYGREDQQLMFYLGPRARWLTGRDMFRPLIARPEPAFVLVERDRFEQRRKDWPDVTMLPLARNTDNRFGTHRDAVVLVTNEAGWQQCQKLRAAKRPAAN
jgi:4-amino-4-deoxy-L-arabinose transferase-like glycosyltransferase